MVLLNIYLNLFFAKNTFIRLNRQINIFLNSSMNTYQSAYFYPVNKRIPLMAKKKVQVQGA